MLNDKEVEETETLLACVRQDFVLLVIYCSTKHTNKYSYINIYFFTT